VSSRAGTAGGVGWRSLGQHLDFEQTNSAATEVKRNSEIESPSPLGEKLPKADEGPNTFANPHKHWEFLRSASEGPVWAGGTSSEVVRAHLVMPDTTRFLSRQARRG
jgi:hypothetical protein